MKTSPTISPHCVDRYLERIAPSGMRHSPDARRLAELELKLALLAPLAEPIPTTGGHLLCVKNDHGYHFVVKIDAGTGEAHTCGPLYFWHETRRHFRALGVKMSKGNPEKLRQKSLERKKRKEGESLVTAN